MVLFRNDQEPAMNCIADNEQQIAQYIEDNFDVSWEDIKDVEDITTFITNVDDDDIKLLFGDEVYEVLE